ncbi:AaceriABR121Cp [[Ashbya] aceris (nom. inval.)]|nr:AaceriABR121Cp [[Ashbya] aceris (nom. inval.)]
MSDSDSDLQDFSSEEEDHGLLIDRKKQQALDFAEKGSDSEGASDFDDDDDIAKEESPIQKVHEAPTEEEPTGAEKESAASPSSGEEHSEEQIEQLKQERLRRLKKLKASKKSHHKTGVVYLSKIPPYMKPAKMRQILSRFGDLDRLFLKREDEHTHRQRIKGGGNKKVMFREGWAEFVRKKDAKLCAETLNGNIIGGKKGSFYHDDVMNVKYLSGFKWADLTEQIARENDVRQSKLQLEISQANKLNAEFIRNVEKSKMLSNIRAKKHKDEDSPVRTESHPPVKQRKVTSNRASAPESQKQPASEKLSNVLHSLF